MKNYMPNPHFLLVSFFVLIIISSGSSLKAQEEKVIKHTIIINNGDTIINGKKLNGANKEEQALMRKEFNFNFDDKLPGGVHVFKFNGDSLMLGMHTDGLMNGFRFKMDGLDSNLKKRIITMRRDMELSVPNMRERALPRSMFLDRNEYSAFERNNSSSFNYNYTDNDGISTRMNIRISQAGKDQLKKITGTETISNPLDVIDITIFPNFSSGKLGLLFNLASRGITKVRILDSDLKVVFSDEAANFSGNYIKQIALPKNGLYYLSVSQNGNWFVRKLIKD